MRVVISESDGEEYTWIGLEPIAHWPDEMPMTEDRITRVVAQYQGHTLTQGDVVRILGN